jgi:hypothetical protein
MTGLLNVLDIAREEKLHKVYWPSSIAVLVPHRPSKIVLSKPLLNPQLFMESVNMRGNFGVIIFISVLVLM